MGCDRADCHAQIRPDFPSYANPRLRKLPCGLPRVALTFAGTKRLLTSQSFFAMPVSTPDSATERLFSYGTLQLESVQLATFGRRLVGAADALPGFARTMLKIEDAAVVATSGQTHHPIMSFTGRADDAVEGMVFEVTPEELLNADRYEVAAYQRVAVTLRSNRRARVYVDARFASSP